MGIIRYYQLQHVNKTAITLLSRVAVLVLIAFFAFTMAILFSSDKEQRSAISSSVASFQGFSGEQEIELGVLKHQQTIGYELRIDNGVADVWVKNNNGERMETDWTRGEMHFEVNTDDEYYFVVSSEGASFSVFISVYDPDDHVEQSDVV